MKKLNIDNKKAHVHCFRANSVDNLVGKRALHRRLIYLNLSWFAPFELQATYLSVASPLNAHTSWFTFSFIILFRFTRLFFSKFSTSSLYSLSDLHADSGNLRWSKLYRLFVHHVFDLIFSIVQLQLLPEAQRVRGRRTYIVNCRYVDYSTSPLSRSRLP